MAITGVETLLFGVEDLEKSTRFFDDFGLVRKHADATHTHYRLDEGSNVILRHIDDPAVPQSIYQGFGVKKVTWGVDSQESIDELADKLARSQDIRRDNDGTVHFLAGAGLPSALKLFSRKKVTYAPDPVNAPGNVNRLNTPRKWKTRARPKTITHTVFAVPNPREEYEWYRDNLNFRMSEEQLGMGFYLRCDGANEHHNLFLIDMKFPALPGHPIYHHTNFGVEDIDELMIGTNYMTRKGWTTGPLGSGRHRIASALFSYLECPAGGEAEYGADSDYIDDNWIPREWNRVFGTYSWMHKIPPFLGEAQKWEFRLHPEFVPQNLTKGGPGWE